MAIVPQTDEELARQRLQVEGRPIADAGRRNQALLAMAPSGALTSGARATVGGQARQQTATAMGDVASKIGSDIFATRQGEAEAMRGREWQTGEREGTFDSTGKRLTQGTQGFQAGQADKDRAIAEQLRQQALAMGGYAMGAGGMPTYQGQISDPNTGELISGADYQQKYGAVTEADIARTQQYQDTLQQRGFTEFQPEVQQQQTEKTKQYYQANPQAFLDQNLSKAWGGYMMNEKPNEQLISGELAKGDNADWGVIQNEIFRAMRTRYGRGDTLARYMNVVNNLKNQWNNPQPQGAI